MNIDEVFSRLDRDIENPLTEDELVAFMEDKDYAEIKHPKFKTPLLYSAVRSGNVAITRYILDKYRHQININDHYGWQQNTFLHLAVHNKHQDIILLLIEMGCKANIFNNYGQTAIDDAKNNNSEKIVFESLLNKYTPEQIKELDIISEQDQRNSIFKDLAEELKQKSKFIEDEELLNNNQRLSFREWIDKKYKVISLSDTCAGIKDHKVKMSYIFRNEDDRNNFKLLFKNNNSAINAFDPISQMPACAVRGEDEHKLLKTEYNNYLQKFYIKYPQARDVNKSIEQLNRLNSVSNTIRRINKLDLSSNNGNKYRNIGTNSSLRLDKLHYMSLDKSPGYYSDQAASAYHLSLSAYLALHWDELSEKEKDILLKVSRTLMGDNGEVDFGLKADANWISYIRTSVGSEKDLHKRLKDCRERIDLDANDLIFGTDKRLLIDKKIPKDAKHYAVGSQLTRQINRFFPENYGTFKKTNNVSSTDEVIIQSGGMAYHSTMVKLWKQAVDNQGNKTNDLSKVAYYKFYRTEFNAGAGAKNINYINNSCDAIYTTEILPSEPINFEDHNSLNNYYDAVEESLKSILVAERSLRFIKQPKLGFQGEKYSKSKEEKELWRKYNSQLNKALGKQVKELSGRGVLQRSGNCTVISQKCMLRNEAKKHGLDQLAADFLIENHWLFVQQNNYSKCMHSITSKISDIISTQEHKDLIEDDYNTKLNYLINEMQDLENKSGVKQEGNKYTFSCKEQFKTVIDPEEYLLGDGKSVEKGSETSFVIVETQKDYNNRYMGLRIERNGGDVSLSFNGEKISQNNIYKAIAFFDRFVQSTDVSTTLVKPIVRTKLENYLQNVSIPQKVENLAIIAHNNIMNKIADAPQTNSKINFHSLYGKDEDDIIEELKIIDPPPTWSCKEIHEFFNSIKSDAKQGNNNQITIVNGLDCTKIQDCDLGENAVVQLASQFDYQESPGEYDSSVSRYPFDLTQGPLTAIQATAAALHRKAGKKTGKLKAATANIIPSNIPSVKSKHGYLSWSANNGQKFLDHLNEGNTVENLHILPQWVKCEKTGVVQFQVCTAAPSFQGMAKPKIDSVNGQICKKLVVEQYKALAELAVIQGKLTNKKIPLHLTLVGQGAFNNPPEVMEDVVRVVNEVTQGTNVNIFFHAFSAVDVNNIKKAVKANNLDVIDKNAEDFTKLKHSDLPLKNLNLKLPEFSDSTDKIAKDVINTLIDLYNINKGWQSISNGALELGVGNFSNNRSLATHKNNKKIGPKYNLEIDGNELVLKNKQGWFEIKDSSKDTIIKDMLSEITNDEILVAKLNKIVNNFNLLLEPRKGEIYLSVNEISMICAVDINPKMIGDMEFDKSNKLDCLILKKNGYYLAFQNNSISIYKDNLEQSSIVSGSQRDKVLESFLSGFTKENQRYRSFVNLKNMHKEDLDSKKSNISVARRR